MTADQCRPPHDVDKGALFARLAGATRVPFVEISLGFVHFGWSVDRGRRRTGQFEYAG